MSERFAFRDLRELFAKANEEKSGDQLAGLAARSERERVAAKCKLADLSLAEIVQQPLIDPSVDDVSRLFLQTFDEEAFRPIRSMTVGEFREYILGDATSEQELDRKSTRLNSSHSQISYAVFCLKKKKKFKTTHST